MRVVRPVLLLALFALGCGPAAPLSTFDASATQLRSSASGAGDSYFSAPWPDDRRLDPDGYFFASEFPNPTRAGIFASVLAASDHLVKGFSLAAPVYLPFTGALDAAALPRDPAAFEAADAPLYLVALDPASPAYGQRLPLEWKDDDAPTSWLPGHVLAVRPVRGFSLEERTLYALVVTTRVRDAKGLAVGPDRAFFDAVHGDPAASGADRAHFAPLVAYLADQKLALADVAGAAVFTTQDGTGELLRLRDWLEAQPAPVIHDLAWDRGGDVAGADARGVRMVKAVYEAPNFMHGKPVYVADGGEFVFDAAGHPVPNKQESLRLSICLPRSPMPAGGWPVVFVSHGTGGDWHSYYEDRTCERLAKKGIATFGIDNVLHGPRAEGATDCLGMPAEDCWFNVVNPVSSRNLLRQAALDHISLRRAVEHLVIPSLASGADEDQHFDLTNFGFFGHSQGGLTGALYTAIDEKLAGSMLSGSGGHVTTTLLERMDQNGLDKTVRELMESLLFEMKDEHLDQMHPAMALLQLVAEVADPLTYSKAWLRAPNGRRKNVLLINGLKDGETPAGCSVAYAVHGGVPQLAAGHTNDVAFALAGLVPLPGPVLQNIPASGSLPAVTAVYRQFPDADHFPAFNDASAVTAWTTFFDSLVHAGVATVPAP